LPSPPTGPEATMALLRFRITGSDDPARAVINLLQSLDGIEHVEETDDLMPPLGDAESSPARLPAARGAGTQPIEPHVPHPSTARKVREAVEALAFDLDTLIEIEEDDED